MKPEVERLNLFSIIQAAGWPTWPLIACSIFAPTIILERLYALLSTKFLPKLALQNAIDSTQQGYLRTKGVVTIAFATQNSSQANKP
jgi:biopolymer transport protein ExbB/TolQ